MSEFQKARKGANTNNATEINYTATKEGAVLHTKDGDTTIPLKKLGEMYTKALELHRAHLSQDRSKLVKGIDFNNKRDYDPNEMRYNRSR
jgi:hypothetical protein